MLHAENLLAQDEPERADASFAAAYAATSEADQYATKFDEDGQKLVALGKLEESLPYFRMAASIDTLNPVNPMYKNHLEAIITALKSSEL